MFVTDIPAGVVHGVLWFSLALTVVSAVINITRSIQHRTKPAAASFLPRGILSACYTVVYASRLTQPVKEISDPTTMFALTLGVAAWLLVWIIPPLFYKPTPTPADVLDGKL